MSEFKPVMPWDQPAPQQAPAPQEQAPARKPYTGGNNNGGGYQRKGGYNNAARGSSTDRPKYHWFLYAKKSEKGEYFNAVMSKEGIEFMRSAKAEDVIVRFWTNSKLDTVRQTDQGWGEVIVGGGFFSLKGQHGKGSN